MSRVSVLALTVLLSSCSALGISEQSAIPVEPENTAAALSEPPEAAPATLIHPLDVAPYAEGVVERYLQITDEIGASGGVDAQRIASIVTAEWLPRERDGFADYVAGGIRTIGRTQFDHLAVQSARLTAHGEVEVAVFLCVDSSSVRVIDATAPEPPGDLLEWLESTNPPEPEELSWDEWAQYAEDAQARPGYREPILVWLRGSEVHSLKVDSTENWLGAHPCEQSP
jgi:hypothetical protein